MEASSGPGPEETGAAAAPTPAAPEPLYRSPALALPTIAELTRMTEEMKLELSSDDIVEYRELLSGSLGGYNRLDQLVEPELPRASSRTMTSCYRPSETENTHNAWYWKCKITGASGGKLAGKKIAVKDMIPVAGVPMMNGCRMFEGFIPSADATVVTRILEAGGEIIGKTCTENLSISGASFNNDLGPVLNPVDKTRHAGGSSHGSATVVALKEADMALGADQGGSIRIPSSWCGVVGHKPTFGLVPYTGAMAIEASVDHIGPIANNVSDCALLLEVIAGSDNGLDLRQPTSTSLTVPEYTKNLDQKPILKIGLLKEGFGMCEERVQKVVREAAAKFKITGSTVEEVSIPAHMDGGPIITAILAEGAYNTYFVNSGCNPGVRGYYHTQYQDLFGKAMKSQARSASTVVKLFTILGKISKEQANGRFYAKAQNLVRWLQAEYDKALATYDVLIMPTLPFPAPKLPTGKLTNTEIIHESTSMIGNTANFNATGHPALTLNCGFIDGLPIGMMIVGKLWDDHIVLKAGRSFELLNA